MTHDLPRYLPCRVIDDPVSGQPLVLPLGRLGDHHPTSHQDQELLR